jgi:hypothetical protein
MWFTPAHAHLRVPFLAALVLATLAVCSTGTARIARADAPLHTAAVETFARDVFFIEGVSLRNPDDTTSPSAPLFNVAGVSLGITWGDWRRANATVTSHDIGHGPSAHTDVRLQLSGLIPGGVYSLFYVTLLPDTSNPLCPHAERALPLTSRDAKQQPDAASFVANASGTAEFSGRVDGHLLASYQVFFEVIYHLDGHTYGQLPNHGEANTQGANCRSSFGDDAMRQFLVVQMP